MTKGQWFRITDGDDPSWYRRGTTYEQCSRCDRLDASSRDPFRGRTARLRLPRVGLSLPTEAQWEYGARGNAGTPWWTGEDATTLAGAANVLDQRAQRAIPQWGLQEGDFDDGHVAISPVGVFRANAFGLFDVHGNVWEWCADLYSHSFVTPRAGDGLRTPVVTSAADRVYRGGCYSYGASHARSASRRGNSTPYRSNSLGVRPARALD
jgi:formylglycine-generating enzyme required for sulfatase activity